LATGNFSKLCSQIKGQDEETRLNEACQHIIKTHPFGKEAATVSEIKTFIYHTTLLSRLIKNPLNDLHHPSLAKPLDTIDHIELQCHRDRYIEFFACKKVWDAILTILSAKLSSQLESLVLGHGTHLPPATRMPHQPIHHIQQTVRCLVQHHQLAHDVIQHIVKGVCKKMMQYWPAIHIELLPEIEQILTQLLTQSAVMVVLPKGKNGNEWVFQSHHPVGPPHRSLSFELRPRPPQGAPGHLLPPPLPPQHIPPHLHPILAPMIGRPPTTDLSPIGTDTSSWCDPIRPIPHPATGAVDKGAAHRKKGGIGPSPDAPPSQQAGHIQASTPAPQPLSIAIGQASAPSAFYRIDGPHGPRPDQLSKRRRITGGLDLLAEVALGTATPSPPPSNTPTPIARHLPTHSDQAPT